MQYYDTCTYVFLSWFPIWESFRSFHFQIDLTIPLRDIHNFYIHRDGGNLHAKLQSLIIFFMLKIGILQPALQKKHQLMWSLFPLWLPAAGLMHSDALGWDGKWTSSNHDQRVADPRHALLWFEVEGHIRGLRGPQAILVLKPITTVPRFISSVAQYV